MNHFAYGLSLLGIVALVAACSEADETSDSPTTTTTGTTATTGGTGGTVSTGGTGGTGGTGAGPVCTSPTEVPCSDAVILQMNLQDDISPGAIVNEADGAGWWTLVDATAGGAFASDPDSYTYGRFTDSGLEKVSISDEDSLDSMDWDIAFRRYVVRVNSGNSGPSCVTGARMAGTPDYDSVTEVPDPLTLHADEYFTAPTDCTLIPDGTGLEGSPATALSGYWTYSACVTMSDNVYIVQVASGRFLKLMVTEYYYDASASEPGAVQQECQDTGSVPMGDNGAANIHFRWAWLS